ncbi:MAG: type transport system permease protein [Solirubrobacteraceae bacterium]|nr:type transport system permease protein [Solirubrobacteraceae bacterium]
MSAPLATVPAGPSSSRPIKGPSAFGSDWRRAWRLTVVLATTDFKLKFFGSVLGYLWQLMRPLMLFGVLYVVFTQFLDVRGSAKYFPVSLLLGLVLFQFFGEATGSAVRSIVDRENLVRKIEFPRIAVPAATVMTSLFNLGLNLIPVAVFLLIAGGRPRMSWLALPLLVAVLAVYALGLAMLLSALFVRYRDVAPIWDVMLQMMFYGSPILYGLDQLREKAGQTAATVVMCNPFAAIMQETRHVFIDPSHLSAAAGLGGATRLAFPLAIIVGTFVLGLRVFVRAAPHVAEEL